MRLYEFNLDGMTIADYLFYRSMLNLGYIGIANVMSTIKRFTNVEVGELPIREINNLIRQFNEAIEREAALNTPPASSATVGQVH